MRDRFAFPGARLYARCWWTVLALALLSRGAGAEERFLQRRIDAFNASEIVFSRGVSNVPFPPLAFIGASYYGNARVETSSPGGDLQYDLSGVTQAAAIPWLLGERDALVIGEYASWSKFRVDAEPSRDFSVRSFGVPMGWLRQLNEQWQLAAFVFPLGHDTDLGKGGWSWQYMGGVFSRYIQSERLWWAYGFYADIQPGEDFFIPYLGATWNINDRWTLSAIMPWPALLYAPNQDWLLRLGVSPSGASWSVSPESGGEDVALNLDAWDFGASVERRLSGGIFASLEAGIGGFRGLRLDGEGFEDSDITIHTSPYIKFDFKFRPGVYAR